MARRAEHGEPVRRHLFVCGNARGSGKPTCGPRGGEALAAAVQRRLIGSAALVTLCGCLGPCFDGPNAVIYPDGVWLAELTEGDADALAGFVAGGELGGLAAKQIAAPGSDTD